MHDATGLAEALLGLNGFGVLAVEETPSEVIGTVETKADFVGCPTCGVRAEAKDRLRVDIRDLPCFGRPKSARSPGQLLPLAGDRIGAQVDSELPDRSFRFDLRTARYAHLGD